MAIIKKFRIKSFKKVNTIIEFQNEDTYENYSPIKIHEFLITNGFKLEKIFKIKLIGIEDRLYSLS